MGISARQNVRLLFFFNFRLYVCFIADEAPPVCFVVADADLLLVCMGICARQNVLLLFFFSFRSYAWNAVSARQRPLTLTDVNKCMHAFLLVKRSLLSVDTV
jgi:hypothetical protein